ncbi:MAG TPA: DUF1684 domain-containing protein [Rhodanobacteraceae bacterium]|nr:DUF1684 domain-containing protein [Rhodanobacteraceae bacterium]
MHQIDLETYVREIGHWRAQRLARLTAPDGWLSLVGLHWLEQGRNTLGSAADNSIVLDKAPAHLGTIQWRGDGTLVFEVADGSGALIDGEKKIGAILRDDEDKKPTQVSFGSISFVAIDRQGRKGLRVRDTQARTRTRFAGIESFPADPSWRIVADWMPFDPPRTLETANVIGQMERYPVPGRAVFERDGNSHELLPVIEVPGDTQLFLIFADRTSGRETYGAARFLYADQPEDGKIVLDFNKAYNPPCAFTAFATCPLAPPENRLDLRVTAGEKKYAGGH